MTCVYPLYNLWQFEQTSTCSSRPRTDFVLNLFPQLQMTEISLYSGWILGFMTVPFTSLAGARGRPGEARMIRGRRAVDKPSTATRVIGMYGRSGRLSSRGNEGDSYPRRIESKNSALLLVALILSRRNSIAERCRSFLGGRRLGAGTSGDLESSTAIRAASSRRTLRCSWWL